MLERIGFASQKGGAGKTTVSLAFAHSMQQALKPPAGTDPPPQVLPPGYIRKYKQQFPNGVVLIDADMVGTEVVHVIPAAVTNVGPSALADVLAFVPKPPTPALPDEDLLADPPAPPANEVDLIAPAKGYNEWLRDEVIDPLKAWTPTDVNGAMGFPVVRSYPGGWGHQRLRRFKRTIEHAGSFVSGRLRTLLDRLAEEGFFAVLDLPAFSVGFAELCQSVLESEETWWVTSADWRDLNEHVLRDSELERVVVNGLQLAEDDSQRAEDWAGALAWHATKIETLGLQRLAEAPTPAVGFGFSPELRDAAAMRDPVPAEPFGGEELVGELIAGMPLLESCQRLVRSILAAGV